MLLYIFTSRCVCKSGFKLQPGSRLSSVQNPSSARPTSLGTCVDVDECQEIPGNNGDASRTVVQEDSQCIFGSS